MEDKTVNFDGVDYNYNDLSDKSKYFITQIQELRTKIDNTKMELDQYEVASRAFTDLLGVELKSDTEFVAS